MKEANKITVINDAGFVLYFDVMHEKSDGTVENLWTSSKYPIDQQKSCDLNDYTIADGELVWPKVHAVAGKTKEGDKVEFDSNSKTQTASYRVYGATLTYHVELL